MTDMRRRERDSPIKAEDRILIQEENGMLKTENEDVKDEIKKYQDK